MHRIRWPKNFSVFSGSDSESDGCTPNQRRRTRLHLEIPGGCSRQSEPMIQGVYLFCAGDQVDLSTLKTPFVSTPIVNVPTMGLATVSPSDAIFDASPLPVSSLIGIPLLMRPLSAKASPSSPHFENRLASQLAIDPHSTTPATAAAAVGAGAAAADPFATRALGTVLVVRADREPLQKDLLDRMCAFHARLLHLAQQRGPGGMQDVLTTWATREKFRSFCIESSCHHPRPSDEPSPKTNGTLDGVHETLGRSWLDLQRPLAAV